MNEQALQQLYRLAKGEGYQKGYNDFKTLMATNEQAISNMYEISRMEGYQKSIDDFKVLVGFDVKKKDDSQPTLETEVTTESTTGEVPGEDISSDSVFEYDLTETEKIKAEEEAKAKAGEYDFKPTEFDPSTLPKEPLVKDAYPGLFQGESIFADRVADKLARKYNKAGENVDEVFPDMYKDVFEEVSDERKFVESYNELPEEIKTRIEPGVVRENGEVIGVNQSLIPNQNIEEIVKLYETEEIGDSGLQTGLIENFADVIENQKREDYSIKIKKVSQLQEDIKNTKEKITQLQEQGNNLLADQLSIPLNETIEEYNNLIKEANEDGILINSLDIISENEDMLAPLSGVSSAASELVARTVSAVPTIFGTLASIAGKVGFMKPAAASSMSEALMKDALKLEDEVRDFFPKDYRDKKMNFAGEVVGQIGFIVGSGIFLGGTPAVYAAGYTMSASEMYREATDSGLSHEDAMNLSMAYGAISAPLEMWGASRGIEALAGRSLRKKILNEILESGAKGFTKEAAEKAIKVSYKPILTETLKESAEEGVQEFSQFLLSKGLAEAYNATKDEDKPEFIKASIKSKEFWSQAWDNFLAGTVGGGIGGVSLNVAGGNIFVGNDYKAIEKMFTDPKQMAKVDAQLNSYRKIGKIKTDEELQAAKEQVGIVSQAAAEVRNATKTNRITVANQKQLFKLTAERISLQKETEGVTVPSLIADKKQRIEELDKNIQDIIAGKVVQPLQPLETKEPEPKVTTEDIEDAEVEEEVDKKVVNETKRVDNIFNETNPEVAETLSDNLVRNKSAEFELSSIGQSIVDQATKAAVAVQRVAPNVRVVLHDTTKEYTDFGKEGTRGSYDPATKTIHIDLSKANKRTVGHETFHSILLESIKSDVELQKLTDDMYKTVNRSLATNPFLKRKIRKFSEKYEDNIQSEEALSELFGMLSTDYKQLSAPVKVKIKQFINKVATKFGLGDIIQLSEQDLSDIETIELLNTMAARVKEGEAITEQEAKPLTDKKVKDKKPEEELSDSDKEKLKTRSQLLGPLGTTQRLAEAIRYKKEGLSNKEIKYKTGWEIGPDGKFRYEIEPLNFKKGFIDKITSNDVYRLKDIIDVEGVEENILDLYNERIELKNLEGETKIYRPIGDLKVVFKNKKDSKKERDDVQGYYSPKLDNIVFLNYEKYTPYQLRSTLAHEIQHAIQYREGFAKGSSPINTKGKKIPKITIGSVNSLVKNANKIYDGLSGSDKTFANALLYEITVFGKTASQYSEGEATSFNDLSLKHQLMIKYAEALKNQLDRGLNYNNNIISRLLENANTQEKKEMAAITATYILHSGEAESRAVEARLDLDKEQRNEKLILETISEDIPLNNMLIFFPDFQPVKKKTEQQQPAIREQKADDDIPEKTKNRIQDIIKRVKNKYKNPETQLKKVLANVQSRDKWYESATDTQKENTVRYIRKLLGFKEIVTPKIVDYRGKVRKIFDVITDITKIDLKQQIQIAKDLKQREKLTKKEKKILDDSLNEILKELQGQGKLTVNQVKSVFRKFQKVDVFSPSQVESFVDYMTKVFADANYIAKIKKAESNLPKARQGVKRKTGINELGPALDRLFRINPRLIPSQFLDKYLNIVDTLSKQSKELNIELESVSKDTEEILNYMDSEGSRVNWLASGFEDYIAENKSKVKGKTFTEILSLMKEDGVVDDSDVAIMKKYRSTISPTKATKKTEQEIQKEKDGLINDIKENAKENNPTFSTNEEAGLAKQLKDLVNTKGIEELSLNELKTLLQVIDNINQGLVTNNASELRIKLNALKNSTPVQESIIEASIGKISKLYNKVKAKISEKGYVQKTLESSPLYYVDLVFGDGKTKNLFNSLIRGMAEGEQNFNYDIRKIYKKLDDASDAVFKSFKGKRNKLIESSAKQYLYMLELEYLSNKDKTKVKKASEYLDKTIDLAKVGDRDTEMLEKIKKEFIVDGNVNMDKLFNSFNKAEKKSIKVAQDINQSLASKAMYVAGVIRGQRIGLLNNYVHHVVVDDKFKGDVIDDSHSLMKSMNESLKPSTKAKSLIERQDVVTALNFDIYNSVKRGSKGTLLDFHLTVPIKTSRATLKQTKKSLEEEGSYKDKKEIYEGLDSLIENTISNFIYNSVASSGSVELAVARAAKIGYQRVLADTGRMVKELISNISFILNRGKKEYYKGLEYRGVSSETTAQAMRNLGSLQTGRLFSDLGIKSRFAEKLFEDKLGVRGRKNRGKIMEMLGVINYYSLNPVAKAVDATADAIISKPDQIMSRPLWKGTFALTFEQETGQTFPEDGFERIAANDQAFMSKYKNALEVATKKSDDVSIEAAASSGLFTGISRGKDARRKNEFGKMLFYNFNNYMSTFLNYEYHSFRKGLEAARGNGIISEKEGKQLMAAVVTRMTLYTFLSAVITKGLIGTIRSILGFGKDEEDEDKNLLKEGAKSIIQTAIGLLISRNFGNLTKGIQNNIIERINEKYLNFLRDGEYSKYKDSLGYPLAPRKKEYEERKVEQYLIPFSGPYGKTIESIDDMLKVYSDFEKPKKEESAKQRQKRRRLKFFLFDIPATIGYAPFAREIEKELDSWMYKDLRKGGKSKWIDVGPTEAEEKKAFKEIDPEGYKKIYGK